MVNGNDSVWDEMDLVPRGIIVPVLDEDEEEQLRLLEMDVADKDWET